MMHVREKEFAVDLDGRRAADRIETFQTISASAKIIQCNTCAYVDQLVDLLGNRAPVWIQVCIGPMASSFPKAVSSRATF